MTIPTTNAPVWNAVRPRTSCPLGSSMWSGIVQCSAMESVGGGVPVIDVPALVAGTPPRRTAAAEIGQACRAQGFFYVTGHGVDPAICDRLVAASRLFFALDQATKMQWRMSLGGRAWRGYFP